MKTQNDTQQRDFPKEGAVTIREVLSYLQISESTLRKWRENDAIEEPTKLTARTLRYEARYIRKLAGG